MAVDKLVDSTQLDADLTSVANAIRTKGGTSAQLAFPAGFVSAVDAIETGGGGEWTTDGVLSRQEPAGDIVTDYARKILRNQFAYYTKITSLRAPNLTGTEYSSFAHCSGLLSAFIPSADIADDTFNECGNLVTVVAKSKSGGQAYAFGKDYKLSGVDFIGSVSLAGTAFRYCHALTTVVLRDSSVATMSNINAFTQDTPFKSGGYNGLHGTLYVPSDLIASYQAATNWSTILGYSGNQILPIEGSIYETQYVDGTPIPTA